MSIMVTPSDVTILVLQYLSVSDLAALALTCRTLYELVEEFGWKSFVRFNERPCYSLSQSFHTWNAREQAQYNTVVDKNWHSANFIARPLSQRWAGKLQPLLAINSSRLLLAAGNAVYSYGFGHSTNYRQAPPIFSELPHEDDGTLYLGYADGSMKRVTLPACKPTPTTVDATLIESYDFHDGNLIESISLSSTHMLSLSSAGLAAFMSLDTSEPSPYIIDLGLRSWVAHLATRSSSAYAAFGTSSKLPLSIHHIHSSHVSSRPSALLAPASQMERPSAVYAITSAPVSSAWGDSDQIIVSGWYDGVVRVHDLRSPSRTSVDSNAHSPAPASALVPVLSVSDPWSFEPIYSLACGGGSMAHIAAGSARHSVVSFWDVRAPAKGWSVHAPGNDSSPVYSLIMDGPRVFGANESRGFVFDFGMGASEKAYPPIISDTLPSQRRRRGGLMGVDEMKRTEKGTGVGVYVTKYSHYKSM